MNSQPLPNQFGLVLPAGGARAAYQVGVLRYIGEAFPQINPSIFTGVSAGSINASYLAQGEEFSKATKDLYRLWEQLRFGDVFQTNFKSLLTIGSKWAYDLFLSRITNKLLMKSLLDASPLAETLLNHIHFWKISRALRSGKIKGLAVNATNYHAGHTVVFFDSHEPIPEWRREQRRAVRTSIRVRHIMASCSIPILFEPIRIADALYGDGSLRFSFPFSPAIHLGASHLFAVGVKCANPKPPTPFTVDDKITMGFVAGAVLNSIFTNSLESDYENLSKMNEIANGQSVRRISVYMQRPTKDFGELATQFLGEVPFHLRQLLRSTASPTEMGDLLSYLMFSPGYLKALLELGIKDAQDCHSQIAASLLTENQENWVDQKTA